MQSLTLPKLPDVLRVLLCLLVLKVTAGIVLVYGDYIPPDFESEFLSGRDAYFFGAYQWAFYTHIASGPCALVLGMLLLSARLRVRVPGWHRRLGRVQTVMILLLVAPSGMWMAAYAQTGAVAGLGFGSLALVTGLCAAAGWRSALRRQFSVHRRWMWRCYLLLCSAILLRLTAGVFAVADVDGDWTYPLAAWSSWLVPLAAFEVTERRRQRRRS